MPEYPVPDQSGDVDPQPLTRFLDRVLCLSREVQPKDAAGPGKHRLDRVPAQGRDGILDPLHSAKGEHHLQRFGRCALG